MAISGWTNQYIEAELQIKQMKVYFKPISLRTRSSLFWWSAHGRGKNLQWESQLSKINMKYNALEKKTIEQ